MAPPQSGQPQPAIGSDERVTKAAGSRWGWRAFLSFFVGGLVAAAGFGAAQLAPADEPADEAAAVTTTTQAVAATASTTDTPRRNTGTVPLVPADVDEPAAFVHQELGPSVVQIEIPDVSLGSGVVFGDGLIMTNNHVVSGYSSVRVQLADGQVLTGEVLGADPINDVAVVSIGPGQDLPIARLATGEKARVGQLAIAIGSPFELQQSVTAGIVSAVDRPVPNQGRYVAMIQTDAPINPGNSGGALADKFGRVIGINTSIQTAGFNSGNLGVGFAIPIDTAVRIADLLVAGEPIEPGFLGVGGDEPAGGEAGVELTNVTEGSAAALAGLRVGDRVLSIDGAPVTKFEELAGLVLANQAGDTVVLEVERNGEIIEVQVTLGIRSDD